MKIVCRDLIATGLVVAIGVPYVGYLVRGEMPFIEDPRGMAAVGLAFGLVAFLVIWPGDADDWINFAEGAVGLLSLALGVTAFALAGTAAGEVLLAVFMGSIAVVWLMELANHAGVLSHHAHHG
jgi:hypothetical protein